MLKHPYHDFPVFPGTFLSGTLFEFHKSQFILKALKQLFWGLSSSQKEHRDLLKFQILLCLEPLETGTNSSSSFLPQSWMKISELSLLWWLSNIPFHHVPCFPKSKTESREVTIHLRVTWQGRKRAWMSTPKFLHLRAYRRPPGLTLFSVHIPLAYISS